MTILQNGPDIQRFSQTASGLRAQFLLLDFQVDEYFQFLFRRTVSVFREHRHHTNGSAVGNLDTFCSDLLIVVWLVYDRVLLSCPCSACLVTAAKKCYDER